MESKPPQRQRGQSKSVSNAVVSANIAARRRQLGIKLDELSARLKKNAWSIPTSTLSRIESGERRIDVDDLTAISVALETSPIRLLDFSDHLPTGVESGVRPDEVAAWLLGETKIDKISLLKFWAKKRHYVQLEIEAVQETLNSGNLNPLGAEAFQTNLERLAQRLITINGRIGELEELTGETAPQSSSWEFAQSVDHIPSALPIPRIKTQ